MKTITNKISRLFAKKSAPQNQDPYIQAAQDLAAFISTKLVIQKDTNTHRYKVTFGPECTMGYPDDIANNHLPDVIPCGFGNTKDAALHELGRITVDNLHKGQSLFLQKAKEIHVYGMIGDGVEHTYISDKNGRYTPLFTEAIPA